MQEKTPTGDEMEFSRQFSLIGLFTKMQINKKVDLEDLYFSLAFSKDSLSQLRDKEEISDYVFGDVVKNEQKLCYKIQRGGKITAYTPGIDSKTRNQIYHQSLLSLKQSRQMTEMQILSQKMLSQKREHAKKFQLQLEQLRTQHNRIKLDMKKLEQQNTHLTQQLSDTKHQLSAIKEQQMRTNDQIKTMKQELKRENEDLLNKMEESLMQEHNKFKQYIMSQFKKNVDLNCKQMHTFQTRYKQIGQFINKMNITKLKQPYQSKFNVNHSNHQIKHTVTQYTWTQYIFNEKIRFNTPYSFKIKINSTTSRNIMIGVIDYTKQKDQRSSQSSANAVCYYGANGYIYGQGSTEGGGFSAGQIVQINVNLSMKTIKWLVSGSKRASCTLEILGDESRIFMPFIEMYDANDTVQVYFD